jgi:hypothetical protein
LRAQDAEKRLLHYIVNIETLTKTPDQPRAEHRLMPLNVLGKPSGSFGVLRGHEQLALIVRIDFSREKTSLGFEFAAKGMAQWAFVDCAGRSLGGGLVALPVEPHVRDVRLRASGHEGHARFRDLAENGNRSGLRISNGKFPVG